MTGESGDVFSSDGMVYTQRFDGDPDGDDAARRSDPEAVMTVQPSDLESIISAARTNSYSYISDSAYEPEEVAQDWVSCTWAPR